MDFNIVKTKKDIIDLMTVFNGFHDSCIKEIKYVSGGYVEKDRSMCPINSLRNVNIIFQSQKSIYPAIEMQFGLIERLNLEPRDENYDCIIYAASLVKIKGIFYWSEWENFKIRDIQEISRTWIASKTVKWRVISALSNKEVYITEEKIVDNTDSNERI